MASLTPGSQKSPMAHIHSRIIAAATSEAKSHPRI